MKLEMTVMYQRNADLLATHSADALMILDPENGTFFGALGAGPLIWECLSAAVSMADLERAVADHYEVPPGTCLSTDIGRFLEAAIERNLVSRLD